MHRVFFLFVLSSMAALRSPAADDFGDAPQSYGTILPGGARHIVSTDVYLGALVDAEPDGVPTPASGGDDLLGSDDEDGITFYSNPAQGIIPWQPGGWTQVRVRVSLSNVLPSAGLDGWVDWNADGDFTDPGERVFDNQRLADIGPLRNDGLGHTLGIEVPYSANPGFTTARFRLSVLGGWPPVGPGGPGEVEDYRVEIVRASQATGAQAYLRDGQVWITWDFDPAAPAQTYEIYRSPVPFVSVANAQLVARLFPQEYAGKNLTAELNSTFGLAAANPHFKIPAPAAGDPPVILTTGKGLCVDTNRQGGIWYYAVVPHGQTGLNAGAACPPVPVPPILTPRPKMHEQQTGWVNGLGQPVFEGNGFQVTFLNFWCDGDDPSSTGLAGFPLMANTARRCVPHHCVVIRPASLPGGPVPLTFAAHGGNGRATDWLPGGDSWRNMGTAPSRGIVVSLEDRLFQLVNGIPEPSNTAWLGYVSTFDPFVNITAYEGMTDPFIPQQMPPPGSEIQPYTIRRQNWILDQFLADSSLSIDAGRISMFGHSAGGKGTLNWVRTFPQRFSFAVSFNAQLGNNFSIGVSTGRFGHCMLPPDETGAFGAPRTTVFPGQNLSIAGLVNSSGGEVHFNDFYDLRSSVSAERDLPPIHFWYGLREANWVNDFDHSGRPDVQEMLEQADVSGTGAVLFWDPRNHGTDTWPYLPGCGFSEEDFWVQNGLVQTRRDDSDSLMRYRRNESYPAFHNFTDRPAHDSPGTPQYLSPPPYFDGVSPWVQNPAALPCWPNPVVTGGDLRGTWGGYFDWYTGLPATDARALRDSAQQWAATAFLTKDSSGGGDPLAPVDECPVPVLTADLAVRRPQNFQPSAGTAVQWMSCDQNTRRVLQSGFVTVDPDTVVRLPDIAIPKAPAAVRIVATTVMDFGDAPDGYQYPVTALENGARHATDSLLYLGTGRNTEAAGVHHSGATSAAEGDDGVTAPPQWRVGTVIPLTITVNAPCRLDAWVDWMRDGRWNGEPEDSQDQIAASQPLTAGVNTLHIFVPPQAVPGMSFARFRVSLGGCLSPTGPAPDGEVEDYPLVITAAPEWPDVNEVTVAKVGGQTRLRWPGNSLWSWQLEFSGNLIDWMPAGIPAGETQGTMDVPIPAIHLEGTRNYFRIRRAPLVTSAVECRPGPQFNLSFRQSGTAHYLNPDTQTRSATSIARNYHLYLPAGWHPGRTWPLILMLHGHSMTGGLLAATQTELRSIASSRGYITVFPDSTASEDDTAWFPYPDPATRVASNQQSYVDDKAFLLSLINHLTDNTGIRVDSTHLYCAGFSNGGSMVNYLSTDANHPFRAFAIMESGTALRSKFEPYMFFDWFTPSAGLTPAKPRPCIMMNMVTSVSWPFEGQLIHDEVGQLVLTRPSARTNVQRWLNGNGLVNPPVVSRHAFINTGTTLEDFPSYENHFTRPDAWWSAAMKANYLAAYADLEQPEIPNSLRAPEPFGTGDGELPLSWFGDAAQYLTATGYPHILRTRAALTYTIAGTWTEETWTTPPGQSDREVKFLTLSDGGHSWPNGQDRVGWNGQLGVMDFFDAH